MRKKEETREWKRAAAIAYQKGEKIPPKPERDNDRRERLAEQRLSAHRSAVTDRGELPGPRPAAEPVMRPRSERETGRMIAMEHMARERLGYLIRTDAPHREIEQAARTARGLKDSLDKTIAARERMGKSKLPAPTYTIEEGRQLAEYRFTRDVRGHAAFTNRLVAQEKIAGAELMNVQRKAEAFESRRHLWRFEIEGQDNKLSLRDIERAIEQKKTERLNVFNFIRPSRGDAIDSQLRYLGDVKKEVQDKLSERAERIVRTVKTAELRQQATARELEARVGRDPSPAQKGNPKYSPEELERLAHLANSNRDPDLLWHIHEITNLPASREWAGVMVGRALMARVEMLKAHDRMQAGYKYQNTRQVPIRDDQGQDHAKSLRQVEPRTIAELVIRQFTDKAERKHERQAVRAAVIDQVKQAEREFSRLSAYTAVRLGMAKDYCDAAGLRFTEMAPTLTREQIQEVKQYAARLVENQRNGSQWREFDRAIPLAERALQEREALQARTVRAMLGLRHERESNQRQVGGQVGQSSERAAARSSDTQGAVSGGLRRSPEVSR